MSAGNCVRDLTFLKKKKIVLFKYRPINKLCSLQYATDKKYINVSTVNSTEKSSTDNCFLYSINVPIYPFLKSPIDTIEKGGKHLQS